MAAKRGWVRYLISDPFSLLIMLHCLRLCSLAGVFLAGLLATPAAQAQAPVVTTRTPARQAVAAPSAGPVGIQFSQPISAATAGSLRVVGSQRQGRRTGAVSGGGTATLSFQPAQTFAPGEQVSVTVPATLLGTSGTAVRPEVYQFWAAAGAGPADFAGGPMVTLPASPTGVAAGDLDNDGDQDLVVLTAAQGYLLRNDGSGVFTAEPGPGSPTGQQLGGLVLADVDGDSRLDVLAVGAAFSNNLPTGTLLTWHNTGSGFSLTASLTLTGIPRTPVPADLDADGDLDALLPDPGYRTVHVLLNDGTGTFTSGTDVPLGPSVNAVAVADLDNDGDLDFAGASSDGNFVSALVNVRLNTGSATFSSALDLPANALSSNVALGDLNGDGNTDLVVSSGIRDTNVLLGTGTGTFVSAPDVRCFPFLLSCDPLCPSASWWLSGTTGCCCHMT